MRSTLLDPRQHPVAVDILHLEVRDHRYAQARAIGSAQRRPGLDARRRLEQLRQVIDPQHVRRFPKSMRHHQAARQIGSIDHHVR